MTQNTLDFGQLAQYGLDRFNVTITNDNGSILIVTSPHMDDDLIQDLQGMMPEALEDGITKAVITLCHDGSLAVNGVRPDQRGTIRTMLVKPRDDMFRSLEHMQSEERLRKIAHGVAHTMLLEGFDFNSDMVTPRCSPIDTAVGSMLTVLLGSPWGFQRCHDKTSIVIPGADEWTPADFKADFNRDQVNRFTALFHEELPKVVTEGHQMINKIQSNLERAEIYLASL